MHHISPGGKDPLPLKKRKTTPCLKDPGVFLLRIARKDRKEIKNASLHIFSVDIMRIIKITE